MHNFLSFKYTKSTIGFFSAILALVFFITAPSAHAMQPTLSLSLEGDGNTVQLNVNGDPNQSVLLFYNKTGVGQTILSLGTTNSNGTLSSEISSSSNGIASGSLVYVTTGGISGTVSPQASWPTITNTVSSFTLSQTGLVLSIGQSSIVTVSNASNSLYLSNNSNSAVANVNVSNNQISVTGLSNGSTVATICLVGNTTNCPSIYVTVQNNSAAQTLSFSQNNFTLGSGQSVPVTISGGTGLYSILNNSNSSIITASLSANVLTLSTPSTSGSASITVCSTDMSSCGIINVTAGSSNASSTISFSQTNPTLSAGQSLSVSVYGGSSGSYYISTNSNQNAVSASMSNSTTLSLVGIANGSSVITVCSSAGGCGTLTVTVNYIATGGAITLSQSTLSVLTGQTLSVTVSGGQAPYSLPNPSGTMYQASLNGNILTVIGVSSGSTWFNVCSAGGGCTSLTVTVNGTATSVSGAPVLSSTTLSLSVGQTNTVSISGSGSYYISNNSTPTVASATVSGSSLLVSGVGVGSTNISVCQTGGSCSILYMGVTSSSTGVVVSPPVVSSTPAYTFTAHISYGDDSQDVLKLQQLLVGWNFLSATPNGHFGPATQAAVSAFQKAHGISPTGEVGPATRNELNQLQLSTGSSSTKAQQIQAIQLQISQLQAQLVLLQAGQ